MTEGGGGKNCQNIDYVICERPPSRYIMPSAKQQRANMKHGGGIRPNVWVLTFGPLCTKKSSESNSKPGVNLLADSLEVGTN